MAKLLNIGAPFIGLNGGDKERARFQWDALREAYEVHNLLIARPIELERTLPAHENVGPAWGLPAQPGNGLNPASIYDLDPDALRTCLSRIKAERYNLLFFRYLPPTRLIPHVRKVLPDARIVIDADMILSRIAAQAWKQNRRISNRFYFFEAFRVRRYEKMIFNEPYLFLMSNPDEIAHVQNHFVRDGAPSRFALVPNVIPDIPDLKPTRPRTGEPGYLLFYGMLGSAVNQDAFRFLVENIYPSLHAALEKHDFRIKVVGRGLSDFHSNFVASRQCSRIDLVGEVDDISEAVSGALICLVPLRMGSGTKTRVLEAAAYGRCVVTTPIGAEGLDFNSDELIVEEQADRFAMAVCQLLDQPHKIFERAYRLRKKCIERYSRAAVAQQLLEAVAGESA